LRPDRESASKADFTRVGFCVFTALYATLPCFLPDYHIDVAMRRHWLFVTPVSVHRLQIAILLKNSICATSFFLTNGL
jgi:NADH:ubiquinone oxidoreductase subunit H